ncbi:MAG: glycosyltransferase family 4 protein [Bacteroidales bacterium]|nr:glycosyltransferase family 4 protein [Bacteroidales bacterium]
MKIGFDAKRAFYNKSGLGNYSRSTIEQLTKFYPSHNYLLFTPSTENAVKFNIPDKVSIIEPKLFLSKAFKSYWRTFRLSKKIHEHKLDVYHGLSGELPHKAHKKSIAKLIVTIHDLIFLRYPELYNSVDRKIYYQKAKYACEIADTVIAISEQTKSDIVNFFGIDEKKIDVVYQGCHPNFQKEVDTNTKIEVARKYNLPENYLLNVGTIEKRKNSLSILKAVNEADIDTVLIIAGSKTDYQEEIIKYASENNIENKLLIINDIPFSDLPAIYQQADIFIYPSLFEGFGIPIIEALYSGVPVITTKGGVFSETGGFSSIYVEPENIEKLSDSILKILDDHDLRRKMIDEGLDYVQKFNEEKIASNLMNVYLK